MKPHFQSSDLRAISSLLSTLLCVFTAAVLLSGKGWAQTFPVKPVRIIVGFAAGGGADAQARIVAEALQKKYGQPVTVDNRPGAGGRLAAEAVAKADADGYTLGAVTGADALLVATEPKLAYKFPGDFQPVGMVAEYPFAIATSATGPYRSLADLINAGKTSGLVTSASSGTGTTQHLAAELLNSLAGTEVLSIPYKGSSSASVDVVGGRVAFQFIASPAGLLAGKLRALAVTSGKRSSHWPGIPAVAETVPGYEVTSWMGLVAPAKVPQQVIAKIAEDLKEVVQSKPVQDRIIALGLEPWPSTSVEMKRRIEADIEKWKALLRVRNIKANE